MANIAGKTIKRGRRAARRVRDTHSTLVIYTTALGRVLMRDYSWEPAEVHRLVGLMRVETESMIEEAQNE